MTCSDKVGFQFRFSLSFSQISGVSYVCYDTLYILRKFIYELFTVNDLPCVH